MEFFPLVLGRCRNFIFKIFNSSPSKVKLPVSSIVRTHALPCTIDNMVVEVSIEEVFPECRAVITHACFALVEQCDVIPKILEQTLDDAVLVLWCRGLGTHVSESDIAAFVLHSKVRQGQLESERLHGGDRTETNSLIGSFAEIIKIILN